ncbi:hypothetical protein D3C86_1284050 [compost metagenome]
MRNHDGFVDEGVGLAVGDERDADAREIMLQPFTAPRFNFNTVLLEHTVDDPHHQIVWCAKPAGEFEREFPVTQVLEGSDAGVLADGEDEAVILRKPAEASDERSRCLVREEMSAGPGPFRGHIEGSRDA